MTEQEFLRLKVGYFIENKNNEIFEIIMDDVFGSPNPVFLAVLRNGDKFQQSYVSMSNYHFFERVYLQKS